MHTRRALFHGPLLRGAAPALALAGVLAAPASACSGDPEEAPGGKGGGGESASTSTGSGTGGSGPGSASSTGPGTGGAGSGGSSQTGGGAGGDAGAGGQGGGPASDCGNGNPDPGEACDDGNEADGDYCAADCLSVTGSCGDGALQSNETCDDGSSMSGCDTQMNGGDGQCVPPGTCSPGYILVMNQCQPEILTAHVHILVDNTCKMTVDPKEFTVAAGQKLKVSYHNHSADYPVDVWMHYNGGYTDLQPSATWNEQYEHCFGPNASEGYADISTACSSYHLKIHCL